MNIGLFFDDDAYTEPAAPRQAPSGGHALGLFGRQVAGRSFLGAYLAHGTWSELVAIVRKRESATALGQLLGPAATGGRPVRAFEERSFLDDFGPEPPTRLIHFPFPIDSRYAWARQRLGPGTFALSGVTHTLCTAYAARQICDFVTAPFQPHDALICTSKSVEAMVRAVAGKYTDYLRDRHGGTPSLTIRLETIPLGVDTEKYRPATPEERTRHRGELGIADDEVAALFVGRLAHHAKAHPFPMFRAVDLAARSSGRKVHLLLAGWAPNRAIRDAFAEGARAFAPSARVSFVDGMGPLGRTSAWKAADLFITLVDNIQETFGLVVVEAMASGLPVVATDWDGYRDLVEDGQTGFLVPTSIVRGATPSATSRLMFGALDYDHFLAEISQSVTVDVPNAAEAVARLVADEPLRKALGEAGRLRAVERFDWSRIIPAYEALWREQESIRQKSTQPPDPESPALYPPLERSFAGYPTRWIDPDGPIEVTASPTAIESLDRFLTLPLTNHVADRRVADRSLLGRLLERAMTPGPIAALATLLESAGVEPERARATLAWMLKYDLLRASR